MLADLILGFGSVEATNFHGSGPTTMLVRDKLVNHPSEQTASGRLVMRY